MQLTNNLLDILLGGKYPLSKYELEHEIRNKPIDEASLFLAYKVEAFFADKMLVQTHDLTQLQFFCVVETLFGILTYPNFHYHPYKFWSVKLIEPLVKDIKRLITA